MANRFKAKTILIIEDDIDIQNFISRVLELEGHQVLKAGDGNTGIDIMREKTVDLVLLDLRLPGRNGWSVLQQIKHDAELSKIPVIVITAIADAFQKKKTLQMGAKRYLIKPMSAHTLANTIASTLHQGEKRLALQKA
jgi:DNA-binding response OmpR family regulator